MPRWACIHDKKSFIKGSPEACGKVAFYALVPLVDGMLIQGKDFVMPDGSTPQENEPITCGGCGAYLDLRFAALVITVMEEQ